MKIVGISYTVKNGDKNYNLHVETEFEKYYSGSSERGCVGVKTESIYVGNHADASRLKVGDEIDISYDKAVNLPNGRSFQPIKKIEVLSSKKATGTLN